jgi:hypothetical protein
MPPGELLGAWLPAAFRRSGRGAAADAPIVRISLAGDGGGDWLIDMTNGELDVAALPTPAPRDRTDAALVWIRQSVRDFEATFGGDPDLPAILPPGWSVLDLLFLDPEDGALARQVEGRFQVEVEGKRRRRLVLDVAMGAAGRKAGRARCVVRVDGPTYERLARGEAAPLEALIKGRIQVEGDRQLGMQAMILLGARLARGARSV